MKKLNDHKPLAISTDDLGNQKGSVNYDDHIEVLHSLLDAFLENHQQKKDKDSVAIDMSDNQNDGRDKRGSRIFRSDSQFDISSDIEDFLIRLSVCYQLYGCPTHIIEINMPMVAKGLGMDVDFAIFPSYSLISVDRSVSGKIRRSTMYYTTVTGLDMYKLQMVDELVRRVQSYSTVDPPKTANPDQVQSAIQDLKLQNASAISASNDEIGDLGNIEMMKAGKNSYRSLLMRKTSSQSIQGNPQDILRRKILDLASLGPGFFAKDSDQSSTPSSDKEHEPEHKQDYFEMKTVKVNEGKDESSVVKTKAEIKKYANVFSKIAVDDALQTLIAIQAEPPLYPNYIRIFFHPLASAGCCGLFFGGGWVDVFFAFIIGLIISTMIRIGGRNPSFQRINECMSSFVAALLTRSVHYFITPLCFKAVTFSAIIMLFKGVALSLSIVEIITKNYVSGTVRLFYSLVISASIGFGLDISTTLFANLVKMPKKDVMVMSACSSERDINPWFKPLFFLVISSVFNMNSNAHRSQLIPMLIMSGIGYTTSYLLDDILNLEMSISSMGAAFILAMCSNAYARLKGTPAILYILSGLTMLVPGSLAVTSFFTYFSQTDNTAGVQMSLTFIELALALSIGIFLASMIVWTDDMVRWLKKIDRKRFGKVKQQAVAKEITPINNKSNLIF